MFESVLTYVMAIVFVVFAFLFALSLTDSIFLKGRINKMLERRMSRKKGSASSIAVLILLGSILIVMLLGFGFVKLNFSG